MEEIFWRSQKNIIFVERVSHYPHCSDSFKREHFIL